MFYSIDKTTGLPLLIFGSLSTGLNVIKPGRAGDYMK